MAMTLFVMTKFLLYLVQRRVGIRYIGETNIMPNVLVCDVGNENMEN